MTQYLQLACALNSAEELARQNFGVWQVQNDHVLSEYKDRRLDLVECIAVYLSTNHYVAD